MADNLTREETNEILLKVYSDNLEDAEKIKKISNIPKLLDKFDGKYDKLVEKGVYINSEESKISILLTITNLLKKDHQKKKLQFFQMLWKNQKNQKN